MIGYINNLRNANYNLMNGRLGYTDRQDPLSLPLVPQEKVDFNDEYNVNYHLDPNISAAHDMSIRLSQHGGMAQQERMIYDKRRSLDHALLFSYQGANISKVGDEKKVFRALINPNKLKQDYDDKIISVGFEYGLAPGDVFEWLGTKTHWLIYLQDLTELAYFRGDIRKCSYEIAWEDEKGKHSTYAAIRGPVETKINYIQKHGISVDTPNFSLNILLPLNDNTLSYFKRYSKFYLQNDAMKEDKICWRVEAIDWISAPGILEINAVEYYSNETEDNIEEGIVGGLIVEQINPNTPEQESIISGETFIKPKKTYEYSFIGKDIYNWHVDKKYPVTIQIDPQNQKRISIKWNSPYCGQFELEYGEYKKTIVVESLF